MQTRWMSSLLAILRILLSIGKEEVILSRLNELEVTFDTSLMHTSFTSESAANHMTGSEKTAAYHMSASCDSMISSSYGSVQPQELLARFVSESTSVA